MLLPVCQDHEFTARPGFEAALLIALRNVLLALPITQGWKGGLRYSFAPLKALPVPHPGPWNLQPIANLGQAHVGDAVRLCNLENRLRPDLLVEGVPVVADGFLAHRLLLLRVVGESSDSQYPPLDLGYH